MTLLERVILAAFPDLTCAEIAAASGASTSYTRQTLRACALPHRPAKRTPRDIVWTDAMKADLSTMWSEGLSISAIGRRMGVSRNAVAGKVRRMGLPKRGAPVEIVRARRAAMVDDMPHTFDASGRLTDTTGAEVTFDG